MRVVGLQENIHDPGHMCKKYLDDLGCLYVIMKHVSNGKTV